MAANCSGSSMRGNGGSRFQTDLATSVEGTSMYCHTAFISGGWITSVFRNWQLYFSFPASLFPLPLGDPAVLPPPVGSLFPWVPARRNNNSLWVLDLAHLLAPYFTDPQRSCLLKQQFACLQTQQMSCLQRRQMSCLQARQKAHLQRQHVCLCILPYLDLVSDISSTPVCSAITNHVKSTNLDP